MTERDLDDVERRIAELDSHLAKRRYASTGRDERRMLVEAQQDRRELLALVRDLKLELERRANG